MENGYEKQESERLSFRKVNQLDVKSWKEFFIDNVNLPFYFIDRSKKPEVLAQNWINMQLDRYNANEYGHLVAIEKHSGKFIGMGGIILREIKGKQEFEIAYALKPAFWGKGFGTEIATTIKNYGVTHQLSNRFISIIHKDNTASMHVAKKTGMILLYKTKYFEMDVSIFGTDYKI